MMVPELGMDDVDEEVNIFCSRSNCSLLKRVVSGAAFSSLAVRNPRLSDGGGLGLQSVGLSCNFEQVSLMWPGLGQ